MSQIGVPVITERATLVPVAIALIAGIALSACPFLANPSASSFWLSPAAWVAYVFLLSVLLVVFLFRHSRLFFFSFCLSTLLFGLFLGLVAQRRVQSNLTISPSGSSPLPYQSLVVSETRETSKSFSVELLLVPQGQTIRAYLQKDPRSRDLIPGDGITFRSVLRPGYHQQPTCYIRSDRWQPSVVSLADVSLVERTRLTFLRWRHQLLTRYADGALSDNAYAVLAAMTLGDKSALDKELRDTYSVTGASHVLALSGLHLSILYMLLTTLLLQRGSRHRRVLVQVFLILSIWAFVLLVGMPVSVVRSALMISIFALFSLGYRPRLSVNLLALAAIIILVCSPLALFDIGFQLSFLSVLSILLFTPVFNKDHQNPLISAVWVSIAAQMGSGPLVAYYFGRFSTYFLLTNLIVLPLAYVILLGGLTALLLPAASPMVGWVVELMNKALTLVARLPMASIEGLHPSALQVILCYVVIACLYGAWYVYRRR